MIKQSTYTNEEVIKILDEFRLEFIGPGKIPTASDTRRWFEHKHQKSNDVLQRLNREELRRKPSPGKRQRRMSVLFTRTLRTDHNSVDRDFDEYTTDLNCKTMTDIEKRRGFRKDGTTRRKRRMSESSPEQSGAGRVPVSTVKVKKTPKLKAKSMTFGGTKAGKPATKRHNRYGV